MSSRVICISAQMWDKAAEFLEERVVELEDSFHIKREQATVSHDINGIYMSPCTTQLWSRDVGMEHDEWTCYFRHWFKKEDGRLKCCRFSHLALMPMVRSCVWQALLYEFLKNKLCNRHAVRLRVEDELTHHSNCSNPMTIKKIGMLAQDWFNLIKCHLGASERPLNRTGLASAEAITINMPGLDYRNERKGWSNRKLRRELAERIASSNFGEIPTRREQEAYAHRWLAVDNDLKQSAVKAVMKLLARYCDPESGEMLLKPWSKDELASIKSEAKTKSAREQVERRAAEIAEKLANGIRLNNSERMFKSRHKELFGSVTLHIPNCNSVTEQNTICKRKQSLQIDLCSVTRQKTANKSQPQVTSERDLAKIERKSQPKPGINALERRKRTSITSVQGGRK